MYTITAMHKFTCTYPGCNAMFRTGRALEGHIKASPDHCNMPTQVEDREDQEVSDAQIGDGEVVMIWTGFNMPLKCPCCPEHGVASRIGTSEFMHCCNCMHDNQFVGDEKKVFLINSGKSCMLFKCCNSVGRGSNEIITSICMLFRQ